MISAHVILFFYFVIGCWRSKVKGGIWKGGQKASS